MQKCLDRIISCSCLKALIGAILFSFIVCDCPFPKREELTNGRFVYRTSRDRQKTFAEDMYVLKFKCYAGYEMIGPRSIECLGDEWSDIVPVCAKKESCPDPGVSEDGSRNGRCCFSGDILQYSCNPDYELVGNNEIQCLRSGSWSSGRPLCRPLTDYCELPPAIPHGIVTGDKDGDYFIPYDEVEVLCEPGYKHAGSTQFVMCAEDGEWEDEFGECIEIFCEPPKPLVNGTIPELLEANLTSFPYGFEITYLCEEGYRLVGGDSWRTCNENGWSGKTPRCEGPYDFDNNAHVIDDVKVNITNPERLILYFAFDVSRRIGKHSFNKSIEFAKAIVRKVGISEDGARAGALTFSRKSENMFLPLTYTTTDEVIDALDKINYSGGGTGASSALRLIRQENIPLVDAQLGKENLKTKIFILTDGKTKMGGNPEKEAEDLKKAGVEIYCIGITGSVKKEALYKIASTSKDSNEERPNVFILQDYAAMSWLVQEITNGTVDYSQCGLGIENVGNEGIRGRILDGKKSIHPWPWMAALYMPVDKSNILDSDLKCGGSIINDYFILTAAQCMFTRDSKQRNKTDILVKLGLTDLKNQTYVQEMEVREMFLHPEYRPKVSYEFDIALLLLDKPIEYNKFVRPICLPPAVLPEGSPLYGSNEFGWATGWGIYIERDGKNIQVKKSQILRELLLPLQPRQRCTQSLMDNNIDLMHFTDRMFCAGDGKRGNDTCEGDSGGPLMQSQLNSDGHLFWTQIGIVSWGIGCGIENTYGFYTHVQKLRSWIDSTVEEAMAGML